MSVRRLNSPITINDIVEKINEIESSCAKRYIEDNDILEPSINDECTWDVIHNLNTSDVTVKVYDSNGSEVLADVVRYTEDPNKITVKLLSSSIIPAGEYSVVVTSHSENEPLMRNTSKNMSDYKLTKLLEDLYYIEYMPDEMNYNDAITYMSLAYNNSAARQLDTDVRTSATVVNGDFIGRIYGDYLNGHPTFIVKTEAGNGLHSTIGVASSTLTYTEVMTRTYSAKYKYLPFYLHDGINDAGLHVSMNAVPNGDYGRTTGTNANIQSDTKRICMIMLVRYILDHFSNVTDAIDWLTALDTKIYSPYSSMLQQEYQIIISGKASTYVSTPRTVCAEFINNSCIITEPTLPIFTNFYNYNADFTTGNRPLSTLHSRGLERYNILKTNYSNLTNTSASMASLLDMVDTANMYDSNISPFWYSDYNGEYTNYGNLTVNSTSTDYDDIKNYLHTGFVNQDVFSPITKYSIVYDKSVSSLSIKTEISETILINLFGVIERL